MNLAIMQPYFLPYIGYFQLINAVDVFVIYDNIQYTKKGWVSRNRMLVEGRPAVFSIPLKKASDYLDVVQRETADSVERDFGKTLRRVEAAYRKAPHFDVVMPLIRRCFNHRLRNLFELVHASVVAVNDFLGIETELVISSTIEIDHRLKGPEKVLSICNKQNATTYVNAIGGVDLYSTDEFKKNGLGLKFLKTDLIEYRQFGSEFVPNLSILDVLMFNGKARTREYLCDAYTLI